MKKRLFRIKIKGIEWTFRLLSDSSFIKKHGKAVRAVTMPEENLVEISKIYLCKSVILHELMHVFFDTCLITDSDLKKDQVEEVMCKIVEQHYTEIGAQADLILKELNPND